MKLLDKLKQLLKNKQSTSPNTGRQPPIDSSTDHSHPVTARIMAWLDTQNWHYEHRKPEHQERTHHLILSFTDNRSDWTCVFRINESNQLIAIFGVLPDTVPPSHFAPMLMKIAYTNTSLSFGSIELDPSDGEVRTKISVDGEFSALSDKALGCYLQGVAGLTELAQRLYDDAMSELEPSPFWQDYLLESQEMTGDGTHTDGGFFMPTQARQ